MSKQFVDVIVDSANAVNVAPGEIIAGKRPEFRMVPIDDSLVINPDNPRSKVRFATNVARIKASLKRNGYKPNHPIAVLERAGKLFVMVGNSRTGAAFDLKTTEPEEFKRIFPDGVIPAFVYTGLTDAERENIAADFTGDEDRQPLDDWEKFLAVKNLVAVDLSQAQIARALGWLNTKGADAGKPNRSLVQPRVTLAKLPLFVQEEMRKSIYNEGGKLKWSDIPTLYKAYNVDNAEGLPYPDGGPAFKEVWDKLQNPPAPTTAGDGTPAVTETTLTPQAAKSQIQRGAYSSILLKQIILCLTGQLGRPDLSLSDFDKALAEMESGHPDMLARFKAPPAAGTGEPTASTGEPTAGTGEPTASTGEPMASTGEPTADTAATAGKGGKGKGGKGKGGKGKGK